MWEYDYKFILYKEGKKTTLNERVLGFQDSSVWARCGPEETEDQSGQQYPNPVNSRRNKKRSAKWKEKTGKCEQEGMFKELVKLMVKRR